MTVRSTEQFIGTDAAAWSSQWTTGVTSTSVVDLLSNAGRMVAQGAAYAIGRALLSGMTAQADTDALVKLTPTDDAEQYFQVTVRHGGTWHATSPGDPQDGYFAYLSDDGANETLKLSKRVAGTLTALGSVAKTWDAGTVYWMRLQATGTTIRVRTWVDGAAEPSAWDISVTDSDLTSGKVGLSAYNGNAVDARTVTWDDLQVTDMAAAPYAVAQFDGNYIGDGTDYAGGLQGAAALTPVTGTVNMQARRSIEPQVMSVSRDGRTLALTLYPAQGTSLSLATFRSRVKQWFTPGKNTDSRYLVLYADDGETFVRIATYVQSVTMSRKQIDITLTMAQPWFEAYIPTVSSANPATVTNAGNVATKPSVALTQTTHKTLRACTVAATVGYGFTDMPVRFLLSDAAATSANTFVFVNGVSVPCYVTGSGGASSAVWALISCDKDGSSTYVDIIYGTSITNALTQTLDPGDMLSNGTSTNAIWAYSEWTITSHPNFAGIWVPASTGYHNGSNVHVLTSDGSSVVFTLQAAGTSDYDSMAMRMPTGWDSTATSIDDLSRVTAALDGTNAQAYVRARYPNSERWTDLWTTRSNATVTTDINGTDGAIAFAIGIENDGTTNDSATLTVTDYTGGGSGPTEFAILASQDATVTVGAAANVDYFTGTYVIGSYTATFADCFCPDATLTIDAATKSITSSGAGAIYNAPKFSDSATWFALEPGSNTVTDSLTATAADTITHRDAFE